MLLTLLDVGYLFIFLKTNICKEHKDYKWPYLKKQKQNWSAIGS